MDEGDDEQIAAAEEQMDGYKMDEVTKHMTEEEKRELKKEMMKVKVPKLHK